MSKVLYFDYAAFCVFTLIMVSVIMKKMTRGKLNRQFQIVLAIAMVATVFDIGAIAFDNMGERHVVTQYIFHTGSLFPCRFVGYVCHLCGEHSGCHTYIQR